jgi:predicted MFS family arabinose efflux permease
VLLLPPVSHLISPKTGEIELPPHRDRTLPVIVVVCVTVLLIVTGQNVFYTYITPWLHQTGGMPAGAVPGLLFLYGLAGAVGLVLAGWLGDRFPRGSLTGMTIGLIATVLLLGLGGPASPAIVIIGLIGWSISFGGIPSMIQTRIMHGTSQRLRDIGSAWVTISFNVAIGGGAFLGGRLLDGFGVASVPFAGVAMIVAGLGFMLATDRFRIARHPG